MRKWGSLPVWNFEFVHQGGWRIGSQGCWRNTGSSITGCLEDCVKSFVLRVACDERIEENESSLESSPGWALSCVYLDLCIACWRRCRIGFKSFWHSDWKTGICYVGFCYIGVVCFRIEIVNTLFWKDKNEKNYEKDLLQSSMVWSSLSGKWAAVRWMATTLAKRRYNGGSINFLTP